MWDKVGAKPMKTLLPPTTTEEEKEEKVGGSDSENALRREPIH